MNKRVEIFGYLFAVPILALIFLYLGGDFVLFDPAPTPIEPGANAQTPKYPRLTSFGWWLSLVLIALGALYLLLGVRLEHYVRGSRGALDTHFRVAWICSVVMTAVTILGQSILVATLLTLADAGFPHAIIVMTSMLALVLVFFTGADFSRQEFAQAVGRSQAPELWTHAEHTAHSLGIASPDSIVITMSGHSYVSDLPIFHLGGKTSGRTLVIPEPFLKGMTKAQLGALIAHDLALVHDQHSLFIEPFRRLHSRFLIWTHQPELIPWISGLTAELLERCFFCFHDVSRAMRRSMQFRADLTAASVRHPQAVAEALVRSTVIQLTWADALKRLNKESRDISLLYEEAAIDSAALFESYLKSVSPSETPDLVERVECLGFDRQALVQFSLPPPSGLAAYDTWIAKDALHSLDARFAESTEAEAEYVGAYYNDGLTVEGQLEVEAFFPPQEWAATLGKRVLAVVAILGLTALLCAILYHSVFEVTQALTSVVAIGGATCAIASWLWSAGMYIELTFDGVVCSPTWRRKLLFNEIERYEANDVRLVFFLREAVPAMGRLSILPSRHIKAEVQLSWFFDEQLIKSEILRYYHRARAVDERADSSLDQQRI